MNMITAPEPATKLRAAVTIIQAVGAAIKEAGAIPSGHLYAALQTEGCTLEQFNTLIDAFKTAGKVTETGNLLYWVD